MYRYTKDAC